MQIATYVQSASTPTAASACHHILTKAAVSHLLFRPMQKKTSSIRDSGTAIDDMKSDVVPFSPIKKGASSGKSVSSSLMKPHPDEDIFLDVEEEPLIKVHYEEPKQSPLDITPQTKTILNGPSNKQAYIAMGALLGIVFVIFLIQAFRWLLYFTILFSNTLNALQGMPLHQFE